MPKSALVAAVVQCNARDNIDENLANCERLGERARERGAELIAFPENFPYTGDPKTKVTLAEEVSDTAQGPVLSRMRALARRLGATLVLGGMPEKSPSEGRAYNTLAMLGPDGHLLARYRK